MLNGELPESWGNGASFGRLLYIDLSNNAFSGVNHALCSN